MIFKVILRLIRGDCEPLPAPGGPKRTMRIPFCGLLVDSDCPILIVLRNKARSLSTEDDSEVSIQFYAN
jgi:hypothetical protein